MRKLIGAIALLLLAGGFFVLATSEFVADNEPAAIEKELEKFINRPTGDVKVKLLKIQRIEDSDTSVAVFSTDDKQVGYVKLENRLFNKVKIIYSGKGTAPIAYRVLETNKGNYGVLYGVNTDLFIKTIQINNPDIGHPKEIDVSNDDAILVFDKLTTDVERAIASELLLFDQEGNDVTREYVSQ